MKAALHNLFAGGKRRMLCLLFVTALLFAALLFPAVSRAEEKKDLTLMIYMCGSNLESDYGAATADMEEMAASGVDTGRVNVLVMNGGSLAWKTHQDPKDLVVYRMENSRLEPVEQSPASDMGSPQTLAPFLRYCTSGYPAESYALILWDHGGGPLGGVCADDLFDGDTLSLAELASALEVLPRKLSWIGFDACLMGSAEVALAVAPYAEYMIASQETEPGTGWDYSFLKGIENDRDGAETGKRVVDAYFSATDSYGITLSCLDLSKAEAVSEAMGNFFGKLAGNIDADLFSRLSRIRMASSSFGKAPSRASSGYDLVDLQDLTDLTGDLGNSSELKQALQEMVVYSRAGGISAGGLSAYHPMRNKRNFTLGWGEMYAQLDYSGGYKRYVEAFGRILAGEPLASFSGVQLENKGFGADGENLFSLSLKPEQETCLASAQLVVMAMTSATDDNNSGVQLTEGGVSEEAVLAGYCPVSVTELTPENGKLSASYSGSGLYLLDGNGKPVAGPISYEADEGILFINARYYDNSGREDPALPADVIYACAADGETRELQVLAAYVYDRVTETYTQRIGFHEEDYTEMCIRMQMLEKPDLPGVLPGLEEWQYAGTGVVSLRLPMKWTLRFLDEQLSGTPLYATVQLTDTQQNTYCTPLVRLENPNLYGIEISPREVTADTFRMQAYAVQDTSALNPGLSIGMNLQNVTGSVRTFQIEDVVVNGSRTVNFASTLGLYFGELSPGKAQYRTCRISGEQLTGLDEIREVSFTVTSRDGLGNPETVDRFTFRVKGFNTAALRGAETVLAEAEEDGLTWQLISLEKNAQGGLDGLMRAVNSSDRRLYLGGSMVINGSAQADGVVYTKVQPHTDVYVPFEISNSVRGSDMIRISGMEAYYLLGLDNILQQYGVTEIRSLKYSIPDSGGSRYVLFELKEPVPFASEEEVKAARAAAAPGEERLLMDGDITVRADRIVVADNGAMIRLTLRSYLDRDVEIRIQDKTFNGMELFDPLGDVIRLGAGATAVTCVGFRLPREDAGRVSSLSSLGLSFRYEDYTTNPAEIRLDSEARLGTERGVYLSPSSFSVTPAVYGRAPSVGVTPEVISEADSGISMTFRMGDKDFVMAEMKGLMEHVKIVFRVENRSQDVLRYEFRDIILNDHRILDEYFIASTYDVNPGETEECSRHMEGVCLTNLGEVRSVSCTMVVERNGDKKNVESYPIRFRVSGLDLTGLVPAVGQPLAETELEGITLRLYSLVPREDGGLEGVVCAVNGTGADLDESLDAVVEGVQSTGFVPLRVPDGCESWTNLYCTNNLRRNAQVSEENGTEQEILQRLGVGRVSAVELIRNLSDYSGTMGGSALLTLPEPVGLTGAGGAYSLGEGAVLLDGDVSVTVTRLISADNGINLTLVMRNGTDRPVSLKILSPMINGHPMDRDGRWCLPPHTTRVGSAGFRYGDKPSAGEKFSEITLGFTVNGIAYENAAVRLNKTDAVGSGSTAEGAKLTGRVAARSEAAPFIQEKVAVPSSAGVRPVQLEAPLGKDRVEDVESAYALVCKKDTATRTDDAGNQTEIPQLWVISRVPLSAGNGKLAAAYSGMSLQPRETLSMYSTETPAGRGAASVSAEFVLFPEKESFSYTPAEKGIDGLDHGIRARYEWTLKYGGKEITVSGMTCSMTDLATGEAVDPGAVSPDQFNSMFSEAPVVFPEDRKSDGYRFNNWGKPDEPQSLLVFPVEGSKELWVLYEINYRDGETEWLESEYP